MLINSTVTNPDGTFSPMIKWDDQEWVTDRFTDKNEEKMALKAMRDITILNREVHRMLVNGGYHPKK